MNQDFLDRVREARLALQAVMAPTPLQRNDHLSILYGADIYLKREDLSPVRSYKLRGAVNAISKAKDDELIVAASAGNHAQGVAYVCKHLSRRGVIFMPVTTPQQKIQKTKMFGGDHIEVRLVGDYFDLCLAAAQSYCEDVSGRFLSPFDDQDIIDGQATVTTEIFDTLRPDVLIMPVGGGGLSAGAMSYLRAKKAETELLLVEPSGGACLSAALEADAPLRLPMIDNFVDGAAVAQIGQRNFDILRHISRGNVFSAPEDRICATMLNMLNIEGFVLEPAGALSIDLLPQIQDRVRGKSVVCVGSGGNFDFERLPEVKERAQRHVGLKKYLLLTMPQRPGALRDFLGLLGDDDDISRFEYLKKSARNFGTILLGIETKDQASFEVLFEKMRQGGFSFKDITNDETLSNFII